MGLQVRLRHALGERVVEVRPRTIDQPLVIGRSKEADLQIPSVTVAPRHCVLFVHDGQWAAQDLGGGTLLNGAAIDGPSALHVGDVITIGSGSAPATIEVDPAGVDAGRSGAAAVEAAAVALPMATPVAAGSAFIPRAMPVQSLGQGPRPIARATPIPPQPVAPPESAEDPDSVDWSQINGPEYEPKRFYVPRRKNQGNGAMVTVGIIAAIVIAGGTGLFVYYNQQAPPPVKPAAPKVVEDDDSKSLKNIFTTPDRPVKPKTSPPPAPSTPARPAPAEPSDDNNSSSSAAPAPPDSAAVASAAPTAGSAADSEVDPHAGDPDWPDVEVAHALSDQAAAILKYDDYARKHPDKNAAELKKYETDAMDRLWWSRITQLANKRSRLTKEIAQKERDLRESRDASFKAEVLKEKQTLEVERQRADDVLRKEMNYTQDVAPDVADKQQMIQLRAARNPDLFESWSKKTARFIRNQHGQTPWGGED